MAEITTNVPAPIFGPTGFIIPADSAILAGTMADINAAFGGNLNPSLSTPQGQLATSLAAIIANADQTFLYYTQQVDPAYSQGRMQDAIARIYFLERNPAEPSVVSCVLTGLSGTVIETGALAQDTAGNLYQTIDGGVIGADGTLTVDFLNTLPGPIPCPAGTLTIIYQTVPGWDTITNPDDGVLGTVTETRASFEARRAASVAGNARGTIQAIQGAVLAVPGVLDAFCYQNDDDSPVTYRGVTLAAHSIYVAAVGGADLDVATAIWTKKSPGCSYNGNTNVTVQDTSPGYSEPFPTYTVTFERPDELTIKLLVQIANNPQIPANAAAQIQAAIIAAFAGADGGPRASIGTTLFASRFYSAVAALGVWAEIIAIQLSSTSTPAAVVTGAIAATTLTVTAVASGTLSAGQLVTGVNVLPGTVILSQLGGTPGGNGTYSVNQTQTAASATVNAYTINQNSVSVDIDQVPVTSAADIAVAVI